MNNTQNTAKKATILLIGAGGREHALAWKIAQSTQLNQLFIAPGNAGTSAVGTNLNINVSDFQAVKKLVELCTLCYFPSYR